MSRKMSCGKLKFTFKVMKKYYVVQKLCTEAVVWRCSLEKVQGLQLYQKRDSGTGVFL